MGRLAAYFHGTLNTELESRSLGSVTLFKGGFGHAALAGNAGASGSCFLPLSFSQLHVLEKFRVKQKILKIHGIYFCT